MLRIRKKMMRATIRISSTSAQPKLKIPNMPNTCNIPYKGKH